MDPVKIEDNDDYDNGDGQEATTNDIFISLHKRTIKYVNMLHGQCCDDKCYCSPNLKPGNVPSVHNCTKPILSV